MPEPPPAPARSTFLRRVRLKGCGLTATSGSATSGPRILLICGVGTGNIGNDDSLQVATRCFKEILPAPQFMVATPHPDGARNLVDYPVIPISQNLAAYRRLRNRRAIAAAILAGEWRRFRLLRACTSTSDLLVVTGTGILDDFGERPWTMPYALLSWAIAARVLRRPIAFMAVGAGPIAGRTNRIIFGTVARLANTISYRDEESRDYLRTHCHVERDARVCPDLVFGHPAPLFPPADTRCESIRIGVGVMHYGGWSQGREGPAYDRYIQTLSDTVVLLRKSGHSVSFLVGQPVDIPAVQDVIVRCANAGIQGLEVPAIETFDDLLESVAKTDLVIATRYHNVVAALLAGRPVVSLSYAPKNRALLRQLGLDAFDRPVETADPAWILDRIGELRARRCRLPEDTDSLLRAWADDVRNEVARVAALVSG